MAKSPDANHWGVKDKNANRIKEGKVLERVHEVLPGITYALVFNEFRKMPEAHARVFLKDPSFEVVNAAGVVQKPLDPLTLKRIAPSRLPPDMVIANLDELTTEALFQRATVKAAGEELSSDTSREEMIALIKGEEIRASTASRRETGAGDGDAGSETMDDADAARMLEAELARG